MPGTSWVTCLLVLGASLPVWPAGKKSYDGYRVVRVHLHGDADWLLVEDVVRGDTLQVELWSHPSGPHDDVDIQVAPQDYLKLENLLTKQGLDHRLLIEDIQSMIDMEAESERYQLMEDENLNRIVKRSAATKISNHVVGKYAKYEEIESWIRQIARHFRGVASVETLGTTHLGNPISVLKLGTPGSRKKAIYLDSGIHAREWISPASLVYIIYHLLSGHQTGEGDGAELLRQLDWYFVPVANPDGYQYTHKVDRLWRKNLSPNANSTCNGTDLNRNWPYHWGGAMTSTDPCSIVYRGPWPGSELETQALMRFLRGKSATLRAYISHHSYTQKWFTRWGYTNSTPSDHQEMLSLATKAVEAVRSVSGESYDVGRPFELLYAYSGGSADWVKGVAGIKYAYTIELRDRGHFGFMLPANYVVPVGQELWAGVRVVASQVIRETSAWGEERSHAEKLETPPTTAASSGPETDVGPGPTGLPINDTAPLWDHTANCLLYWAIVTFLRLWCGLGWG